MTEVKILKNTEKSQIFVWAPTKGCNLAMIFDVDSFYLT
jgi:hypothetical protein